MATGTSFKQQCPSCEAMVPIKDPSLVGKKIDCPKCKYRFKVEEPPDLEEDEDEAPRSQKGAATKAKPGGSGAGAKGKAAPRRDDEDEDEDGDDRPKKKKKAGSSSTMLIVGIVLALVAVSVLGVCGWVLFSGPDDSPKTTTPPGAVNPQVATTQQATKPAEKPGPGGDSTPGSSLPVASDITNLLPNDTQVVLSMPFSRISTTALRSAFLDTEGGFKEARFKKLYGFGVDGLTRIEMALNVKDNWVFTVVRTKDPIKDDQFKERLKLVLDPNPITGKKSGKVYDVYQVRGDLDSLSNLLFKGAQARDRFLVYFLDSKTLIFADAVPMKKFLEADAQPEQVSKPSDPANPDDPPAGGGGRLPGGRGLPGGAQPPAEIVGQGSYLTVPQSLKAMLDKMEKSEQNEKDERHQQVNLLTLVADMNPIVNLLAEQGRKELLQQDRSMLERMQFEGGMALLRGKLKTVGTTLAELKEEKLNVVVALEFSSEANAKDTEKMIQAALPGALPFLEMWPGLKIGLTGAVPGTGPGIGVGTRPGGATSPAPPGAIGIRTREIAPPPRAGAGVNPGIGPGNEEARKDGNLTLSLADKTVVLQLDATLTAAAYQNIKQGLEEVVPLIKGTADLVDNRWRVHELAAASQAYLKDKGEFPRGALPRSTSPERGLNWRPDQRLSWAVDLLPYLADEDASGIDKEASWNEGKNLAVSRRVIPQFLNLKGPNPASPYILVPGQDPTHPFAATHFVGIAGVGLDAALYAADDPGTAKKRGIFGYDRVTRKEDIKDKLSETIVFLQVPGDHKSSWMAGGGATVRGVSEEVDAVAPFVCTVYPSKPGLKSKFDGKKGTLAIMADGKVRFIPADIDPNIFRAMCTIAGSEKIERIDDVAPVIAEEERSLKTDPGAGLPPPPVFVPPVPPSAEKPAEKPKDDKP